MKSKEKKPPRVKLCGARPRYRIELVDDSRLERVWSVRASRVRLALAIVAVICLCAGTGVLIVGFTPIKRQIPGYMTGAERASSLQVLMRIDSLQTAIHANQAFMDNLSTLLDTDRTSNDSVAASGKRQPHMSIDSLISSSARERKFVAMMEESEKYNLKVLSPLAAEGMLWAHPVPDGIVLEQSRTLPMLQLIVPKTSGVRAIADGRVIDRAYDPASRTFSIMVQHEQGFVSRYSSLGRPLVDKGAHVLSGQAMSEPRPQGKTIGIEMWRDGTPLIPADYVARPSSEMPTQSIENPRGR